MLRIFGGNRMDMFIFLLINTHEKRRIKKEMWSRPLISPKITKATGKITSDNSIMINEIVYFLKWYIKEKIHEISSGSMG